MVIGELRGASFLVSRNVPPRDLEFDGFRQAAVTEMIYNARRRHGFNNQLSPVEFAKRLAMSLQGV